MPKINRRQLNHHVYNADRKNLNFTDRKVDLSDGLNRVGMTRNLATARGCGSYVCGMCKKEFQSLGALRGHLDSAAHGPRVYVCPVQNCRKRFKNLAALAQHVAREPGMSKQEIQAWQRMLGDLLKSISSQLN